MLISPCEVPKKNFTFIFHLSGWALVALSCFALQVPDVRGLQVPGPPCAFFLAETSLTNVIRTQRGILDHSLVPKPFSFRQRTVLQTEEARPGVAM